MAFKKGEGGRPKGATNKATRELKDWAHEFFQSEEWRESARRRMVQGKAPHLEGYLLALTHGKPTERIEHSGEAGGPIKLMFGGRHKPTEPEPTPDDRPS